MISGFGEKKALYFYYLNFASIGNDIDYIVFNFSHFLDYASISSLQHGLG